MSSFVKNRPTSIIETYRKGFSNGSGEEGEGISSLRDSSQQRLGDSSDSIKRFLDKSTNTVRMLGGVLVEDVEYTVPGEVVMVRHSLRRPYSGMSVVDVVSPKPYTLNAYLAANQTVAVGGFSTIQWVSTTSLDPFSSLSSNQITVPFNCFCDIHVTIDRDYNSGAVGAPVLDEFFMRDISGSSIGSYGSIYRQTATTTLLANSGTLSMSNVYMDSSVTHDWRFSCASFTQDLLANNSTRLYISENKTAYPRIDETTSLSQDETSKTIFVPVVCDKACRFSVVVY